MANTTNCVNLIPDKRPLTIVLYLTIPRPIFMGYHTKLTYVVIEMAVQIRCYCGEGLDICT